ncbi:hypothetical protein ACPOL_0990 [Acidisarcina polymorpha]|uniref:Uncharacterized protein n=1 Tax=Acidisarcina polymorpha TaxID=2211140 RepID=A0A2Z5FU24_9BACT|nr:hypothetical protein [Acidisarcina polymorpha]AXC10341.1 hypothetical protein ACPOL_0990 [Acidisarcina polymorpha]
MHTTEEKARPLPVATKTGGRPAREATGINLEQRGPIDPRMPNAPPA